MKNLEWYNSLIKPAFTPPQIYFPIAWGILYALMAVSLILVLFKPASRDRTVAVVLFVIQLVLNLAWSYLFFDMKLITGALIDVVLLLIFVIFTMIYFYRVSKLAAILLVPYLLQTIFATYLNAGFRLLN